MHFLWFRNLFIFILLSSFSSSKAYYYPIDSEENEHTNSLFISSKTTESSTLDEPAENVEDYDDEKWKTKTTTPMEKITKHSSDDFPDYYEDHEDIFEHEDEEKGSSTTINTTISSSSTTTTSSSALEVTTKIITETISNKNEIPLRSPTRIFPTISYDSDPLTFFTTTIDREEIVSYATKANRDRLLLKIFTITVSIGITSLAIALITIHIVRKSRHYHGYRTTANTTSNEQSKNLNNIYI